MKKEILLIFLCILSVQIALSETIEVSVDENELLNISDHIKIYDPDGDPFTFSYEDPLDEDGLWQTTYKDAGVYYTNITASDGRYDIVQDIKITVNNINMEPVIESIYPEDLLLTINELDAVNFRVVARDPEEDKIYYSWKLDNEEVSAEAGFRYKADYYSSGTHTLKLTASDGDLKKDILWDIDVLNTNAPPEFEEMEDIEIEETETATIVPKAIDIDGDKVYYSISKPVGDDGIWTTGFDDEGIYLVNITASDTKLETIKAVKIIVQNKDRIPVITVYSPEQDRLEIDEGEELSFEIKAVDPDRDDLEYSWKIDSKKLGDERKFIFRPGFEDAGAHSVEVSVSDGTVSVSREWLVAVKDINRAPVLEDIEDITVDENDTIILNATGSDPDKDDVKIKFSKPFDKEGVWKTGFDDSGTYQTTITISDGDLSSSRIVKITINNKDRPLVFDEISPIMIYEGDYIEFEPYASDPDGEEVRITAHNLPEGSSFVDSILIWTPDYNVSKRNTNWLGRLLKRLFLYNLFYRDQERFQVILSAESGNMTLNRTLNIIVKNKNMAPVINDIDDIYVQETDVIHINITPYDPDGDHMKIRFYSPLNKNGEWLTGYDDKGEYNSSVTISDGDLVITKGFSIYVGDKNRIPVISIDDKIKAKEGKTITLEPKVIDLDGDNTTITYSGWMDSAEYTATENDSGVYTVTVEASDGKDTNSKDVTIFVDDVKERSALWFYLKYIILGIIILAVIIMLLNLREKKDMPEKKEEKPKKDMKKEKEDMKKEKIAKKEAKAEKIAAPPEQAKEAPEKDIYISEWIRKPEVKKGIGIALLVILVAALFLANFYFLKPSGEVRFEKIDPQEAAENSTIEIPFYAKNADNYSVLSLPEGAKITGRTIIWTPGFGQSGSYTIGICAYNNISSDCINISIDVKDTNRIPRIHSFYPKKKVMYYLGSPLAFYVNATDDDKEELEYVWKLGGLFGKKIYAENMLKITFNSVGKRTLKVEISDKESSVTQEWAVDVIKKPPMTRKILKTESFTMWDIEFPEKQGKTISYVISDEDSVEVIEVEGAIIKPETASYEIGGKISGDVIEIGSIEEDAVKTIIIDDKPGIEVVRDEEGFEFVLE